MDNLKRCPECSKLIRYRAYKRHMVATHGWRYFGDSPNDPRPLPSWYRWRDEKGRFLPLESQAKEAGEER